MLPDFPALRATVCAQGGRYESARLAYLDDLDDPDVDQRVCTAPGCHGTEGVKPAEAGMTGFLTSVHWLHPGDFPCTACGGTGLVPNTHPATPA